MRFVGARRFAIGMGALALLATARPVHADSDGADVAAAARAFQRGQRAQLRHSYVRAAELFELADDAAPTAAALRSAIRNWNAAGNLARAATLASRALERYPNDAETVRLAAKVVAHGAPSLGLLRAHCEPACLLTVDGRAATATRAATHDVYLVPGEHALLADYGEGRTSRERLRVAAGELRELALRPNEPARAQPMIASARATVPSESAPPPASESAATPSDWRQPFEPTRPSEAAPAPAPEPAPAVALNAAPSEPPHRDRRLPPVAAVVGIGLTLGLGGVLVWSITDTEAARDRYVAHPTAAGYRDGIGREDRTNGLIGGVVGMGTLTLAIAIFATNWHAPFAGGGGGARRTTRAARLVPRLGWSSGVVSAGVSASFD